MGTLGHNAPPLADRIFLDPDTDVEDVLGAVSERIQRQYANDLRAVSEQASQLAANRDRLPEALSDAQVGIALDLLGRLSTHDERVADLKDKVLSDAKRFIASLEALCSPLNEGISALEKALRVQLTSALVSRLDEHNAERTESEPKLATLTLRGSSGTKATISDSEEVVIDSVDDIPRKFLAPDLKKVAAAVKAGEEVPGTGRKRKTSLRIST